jgi:hypothetical protein
MKDKGGAILADFIVGKEVLSRPGMRFVRVPGQSRVYASRVDVDLTTNFQDWINPDLLQISREAIERIELRDYSVNEQTLRLDQRDNLVVHKRGGAWSAERTGGGMELDTSKTKDLLSALDQLKVAGVRPKPEGLSSSLKTGDEKGSITQADQLSLQDKGFYLSRDGQLLSNEGEMIVTTSQGVTYTLRFGEVLFGSGLEVTAGTSGDGSGQGSENRYLFVIADFETGVFGPRPPAPANEDFRTKDDSLWTAADSTNSRRQIDLDAWEQKVARGREIVDNLNTRFADWYYVISGEDFGKLDLRREDLIREKA